MKAPTTLPLLALAAATLVNAHDASPHHHLDLDLLKQRDFAGASTPQRMDRLLRQKRQLNILGLGSNNNANEPAAASSAAGGGAAATSAAAQTSAAAAAQTSASPAAATTSATAAATTSQSSAAAAQTTEAEKESSSSSAAAQSSSSSSSAAAETSSTSSAAEASSSSSSARDRSSSASSVGEASTVTSTQSASAASSSGSTSGSASASAASLSASAAAASEKKDEGESGGIKKAVLIPIIVVASCVAAVAVIWTIIRKTKFSPSRRFEAKLEPIDFVPDHDDPAHGLVGVGAHHRNESMMSGVGGAGGYGGGGYAASLARSDSGGKNSMRGMAMSESSHNIPSIPYNGPSYVQNPYYGAPAYNNAQPGYPHEQAYGYADLHRAGSLGPSPGSPAPSQLGRMGSARSHVAQQQSQPMAYDYAAQARAQSRNGMRY